jgi:NRAMP (natural resistance-associated macrophage protein)-like metal ion transporter
MATQSDPVDPPSRSLLSTIGPGVITGAADDDPSGIATYTVVGAQYGTSLLWTSLLTWPLMAAVQMMCARIGMVTGIGLIDLLRRRFPRPVIVLFAVALLAANTINVGADLAGMADAAELFTGINSHLFVLAFGVATAWATIRLRYGQIANTLRWLTLVLLAYVVTVFLIGPDWGQVFHDTFVPTLPKSSGYWAALVAILGTTISPYLFFWQASQEVEEEKAMGRTRRKDRVGATAGELKTRALDVGFGTLFSNVVMFFIILAASLTLHAHGLTHVQSSREAAEALRPLAGAFAAGLYALGVLGVGFLAIPTLTASAGYALSETFGWRQGLDVGWSGAPGFYGVVVFATLGGIAMDFLNLDPVSALFWAAVINGVLAPFLLLAILMVSADRTLMQGMPSGRLLRVSVAAAIVVMFGGLAGMAFL